MKIKHNSFSLNDKDMQREKIIKTLVVLALGLERVHTSRIGEILGGKANAQQGSK